MRFAYIDSQGNEVEIPSEDALRLRIELGAIVEGTSFFDGSSGRWAPAAEHEIFRRLKRDLAGAPGVAVPVGDLRPDRGEPPPIQPSRPTPPPQPAAAPPPPAAVEVPVPGSGSGLRDDDDFDLGDFGALDLEEAGPVPARSSSPPPESPIPHFAAETGGATEEPLEADPWTVPGRDPWAPELDDEVEPTPSMDTVGFGDEPAPPIDEDAARHPFEADEEMPEWLRNDPEFGEDAPPARPFPTREQVRERYEADHGVASPAAPAPVGAGPRPRPAPRRASGAPGRTTALLLVGLSVVAGGTWFLTRGGDAEAASDTAPRVELPSISPSLEPVFRTVAAQAFAAAVDSLRTLPAGEAVPAEPHGDWLAGRYMANAGRYADVRAYWEALGRYVQVMRARESEVFGAALEVALDTVTLAPDDRAAVVTRSRAGFEAAAVDRDAVYAQLRAVIDAALSLHVFLEQNQESIEFEPAAAGLSRDPVLEAVPSTEALGDEMWNQVAEITSALDALGFLDRVTTERLLGVFFEKLSAVDIR